MRGLFAVGAALRGLAQLAAGHQDQALLSKALMLGVLTQRAFVGGTEVAKARFREPAIAKPGHSTSRADRRDRPSRPPG